MYERGNQARSAESKIRHVHISLPWPLSLGRAAADDAMRQAGDGRLQAASGWRTQRGRASCCVPL